MIIWSGYGWLTVLIAILGFCVAAAIQSVTGIADGAIATAIGFLLAAIANWFVGVRLNGKPGRELVDPKTGQTVILTRHHKLFFVAMQYWSVLLVLLGLAALVMPRQG